MKWLNADIFDCEVDYKLTMEDGTQVYLNANDGARNEYDENGRLMAVYDAEATYNVTILRIVFKIIYS